MKNYILSFTLAIAAGLFLAGTAQSQLPPYIASLDGHQAGTESPAVGKCTLSLSYWWSLANIECEYSDLSSGLTEARIYIRSLGDDGNLALDLDPPKGAVKGKFFFQGYFPFPGELYAKRLFVRMHTTNFPNGEIRGQLKPFTVDSDMDGDGAADIAVFRQASGQWHLYKSVTAEYAVLPFGTAGDKVVPADYTGDGKADIAIFRPSTGDWYVLRSDDYAFYGLKFGMEGDIPAPGDYDGDIKVDIALYRPAEGAWYILKSHDYSAERIRYGMEEDLPVAADYSDDGIIDIALFRPSTGTWYIPQYDRTIIQNFGKSGDIPVPGDWTGDDRPDLAVFRPSDGMWYILGPEGYFGFPFGSAGDTPVPADYDADGKLDAAVYRAGTWYINGSTEGLWILQFGAPDDVPATGVYVR